MLPVRVPRSTSRRSLALTLPTGLLLLLPTCARPPAPGTTPEPPPEPAALQVVRLDPDEAANAAREIRGSVSVEVAEGLQLDLWASEQLIADPIALTVDSRGRVYVTQTTRSGDSDLEIRQHPDWMIESITFRTVEDRRNFIRRVLAPENSSKNTWLADHNGDGSHDWRDLAVLKERIYRIEDVSGDGVADISRLIVEDFNTEITDVAGGLFLDRNDLFVAIVPDLWRLRDTNGDGVPDSKEVISHGYGVHIGFGGHGLSGVTRGPDGRIYWSIGDWGMDVVDREGRRWSYPNQGVIVRAEPDGSGFEVFAAGLRNIHEFAFDEHGNLISVDNDGDHQGESERLVYIVEGSDAGWRINWQFGKYTDPDNNTYKVWMDEGLYRPRFEGQAAYIIPPLASYHSGPTGLVYNPGTALSEEWRNHFFFSEFTGTPQNSRVYAFQLREKGAGFELASERVALRGVLATGLAFGPDGALYIADWIEGWGPKKKGRIWKLDAPAAAASPLRAETKALLAEDFGRRSERSLRELLGHPDMRVRLKAQFELADRGAARELLAAARQKQNRLARLHGLWGIGQLARRNLSQARPLVEFLRDADAEVRAQAAKVIGDVRYAAAADALVPMLRDSSPRVRFFAAEALGRIRHRPAVQPLIAMLEENNDEDVYLRHAGSLALARIGDPAPVVALADHPSRAVRIAAVVALRRMGHPGVARFLRDRDEYIVTEAARAINDDDSIEPALPDLARVLDDPRFSSEPLLRRAINANLRLGTEEAARRVAAFAARTTAPEEMRVEALATLGVWPKPSVLDRVDGVHRGAVQRDPAIARAALLPRVEPLLADGSAAVRSAVIEAVGRLELREAAPALLARLQQDPAPEVRVAALEALQRLGDANAAEAVRVALGDQDATVRMAALRRAPSLGTHDRALVQRLASVLARSSVEEQQAALAALGNVRNAEAERVLGRLVDQLIAGTLAPEIQLDLMEAVEANGSPALLSRLERYRATKSATNDPVAAYSEALRGGNAARGRLIVLRHQGAQCLRCHAIASRGSEVGPNLRTIGATLTREQLLEALVAPSARIAPGYGTGPSAMPPMGGILTRRELRDVVEYLTTLK